MRNARPAPVGSFRRSLFYTDPWTGEVTIARARPLRSKGRPAPAAGRRRGRTIKRITDKGFGFIAAPDGTEYFFHQSACTSTPFDSMREGEQVTFTVGQGPKGPRAENVKSA